MITSMRELNKARDDCYAMVRQRATISAGTSAVPVISLDIAADVAILLELIPAVNRRFGLAKDQIASYDVQAKDVISTNRHSLGVSMIGTEVTKTLVTYALRKIASRAVMKQVLKFVPFLGWAANAAIGFRAMKHLGNAHVDDCYAVATKLIDLQVSPT